MDYLRMSQLVGKQFVFKSILSVDFQKWDDANKTMLKRPTWDAGYRLTYTIETDQGQLSIGEGQLGTMLKAFFDKNTCTSNIKNGIVEVKSNGKTGMEIRYYFNSKGYATGDTTQATPKEEMPEINVEEEGIPLEDIPF